jgi:hypothetical protein
MFATKLAGGGKRSTARETRRQRHVCRGLIVNLNVIASPLANHRTHLWYPTSTNLSNLRLAELGDTLDVRSVGASPALRLLHPGCVL